MIIKNNLKLQPKLGFDIRNVSFEKIHVIDLNDFKFLMKYLNIKDGNKILDAGCGYGAITREILNYYKGLDIEICLIDIFIDQLERSINKLNSDFNSKLVLDKLKFNLESIEDTSYNSNYFDIVVAKMLYHELPISSIEKKNRLLKALKETNRILKPKGKLAIWDVTLSENNQTLIQNIIRKKDELAGFEYLVKNRYLPRLDEWNNMLSKSGFKNVKIEKNIKYIFNSKLRLDAEFNKDINKLNSFHQFIREEVKKYPKTILNEIEYNDNRDEISFIIPKAIISAKK